jgi:hypothetical protein
MARTVPGFARDQPCIHAIIRHAPLIVAWGK